MLEQACLVSTGHEVKVEVLLTIVLKSTDL